MLITNETKLIDIITKNKIAKISKYLTQTFIKELPSNESTQLLTTLFKDLISLCWLPKKHFDFLLNISMKLNIPIEYESLLQEISISNEHIYLFIKFSKHFISDDKQALANYNTHVISYIDSLDDSNELKKFHLLKLYQHAEMNTYSINLFLKFISHEDINFVIYNKYLHKDCLIPLFISCTNIQDNDKKYSCLRTLLYTHQDCYYNLFKTCPDTINIIIAYFYTLTTDDPIHLNDYIKFINIISSSVVNFFPQKNDINILIISLLATFIFINNNISNLSNMRDISNKTINHILDLSSYTVTLYEKIDLDTYTEKYLLYFNQELIQEHQLRSRIYFLLNQINKKYIAYFNSIFEQLINLHNKRNDFFNCNIKPKIETSLEKLNIIPELLTNICEFL